MFVSHAPLLIICWQVHKASALKEYTGQHFRNASRDRLARVRGFTAPSDVSAVDAPGTDQTDYAARLQVGDPFATLFKLPSQRNEPTTYAVGVLSATAPPSTDTRVGSVGGQVVKGHLMKLLVGGNGTLFEWEARKLCTEITYICPLKFVIELDPDMSVDKMTYVFSMEELFSTQEVLVETVGLVEGFNETPVMRTVPHTVDSLPLHADLTYTSGVAPTPEEVPASSTAGTVECPACKMAMVVRELRQHVGGHIQETKVRPVCLLRTSMYPRLTHANPRVVFCCARRIALP